MPDRSQLLTGTLYALAAGLMWGTGFIAPLLLPEYSAASLTVGRYLSFGLFALGLAWVDRRRLADLSRADWREAVRLALTGNLLYYLLLSAAIQRSGAPLPTVIIGTLPLVLAVVSNHRDGGRDGRLAWGQLLPSLLLIGTGIALVNRAELAHLLAGGGDAMRYATGAVLAVGAMLCWTWYPLRNADWLRAHPDRSPTAWATAQGVATLPLALILVVFMTLMPGAGGTWEGGSLLGPAPWRFAATMVFVGLTASWLGTLCWNQASQRLPTALAGQLIVFETLAALAYAFAVRGQWPPLPTVLGVLALVAGVAWALRARRQATAPA